MGYINIFVSKDATIQIKGSQLVVKNSIISSDHPLEDINSIMIENLQTTISTHALSKLAENGIVTFICNQSHLPCGVVLPFCQHYQTLSVFENQITCSKPLQKQIWQTIVKNKIENQNTVLNMCGGNDNLKSLVSKVQSGDSTNIEATASLQYFKLLFSQEFKRRQESATNALLNYGYAIIRGFAARSLAVHGLLPFFGIHHCNQFNQFNLADDIMEPFRPLVDLYVKVCFDENSQMDAQTKAKIYNLINYDIQIDGQNQTLSNAIDMYVESFAKCMREQKNIMKKIVIMGLTLHQYE